MRGTEYGIPKCATLACAFFELKAINTQQTQVKFSTFPLSEVKNLGKRAFPGRELLPVINFWSRKTYPYGMANIVYQILLSSFYCELPSSPSKCQTPSPYFVLLRLIKFNCPTAFVSHALRRLVCM